MSGYIPSRNTAGGEILAAMQKHPADTRFRMGKLMEMSGVPAGSIYKAMTLLRNAGLVRQQKQGQTRALWSLSTAGATTELAPACLVELKPKRTQREEMTAIPDPVVYGSLRTFMATGDTATCGDPLRGLADAMDAARKVLAAKDKAGARFKGSEVDLLVARELRQIAEAAERATVNLVQALEVMG